MALPLYTVAVTFVDCLALSCRLLALLAGWLSSWWWRGLLLGFSVLSLSLGGLLWCLFDLGLLRLSALRLRWCGLLGWLRSLLF